jgi:hypothetical protein
MKRNMTTGPRLSRFLPVLLMAFLAVSCSGPTYLNGNGSGNTIPSPPAGGPPYTVTYFDFTVNTYGNPPVDGNSYASAAAVTVLGQGTLVWTGFTFKGWNTMQTMPNNLDGGNGGTFYLPGADFPINSNVYLFAVWQ